MRWLIFTRNRIYLLKVFSLPTLIYLFPNWFSTRVSHDQKYICGCRVCACIKLKNYSPEIKNVMRTWCAISIIAENKPHAHHKTHLYTIKGCIPFSPLFSDLDNPDCLDFHASWNKIWIKSDPYNSSLLLWYSSQFQRIYSFYFFPLN